MDFDYRYGGRTYKVSIKEEKNTFKVGIDGNEVVSEVLLFNESFMKFQLGNLVHKAVVTKEKDKVSVFINGMVYILDTATKAATAKKAGKGEGEGDLNSPISGKVVKVMVGPGDVVEAKQDLMIIEAMKMEHKIKAPYPGVVKKVNFKVDDRVDIGQLLVDLERSEEKAAE